VKISKSHIAWITSTLLVVLMAFLWTVYRVDYASKPFLISLILVPLTVGIFAIKADDFDGDLTLANADISTKDPFSKWVKPALRTLAILGLSLLLMALGRPQSEEVPEEITKEGIDIILAMDVSLSMLAKDFNPNRLEVSKQMAQQFVRDREDDRVGIVIYSGESFPRVPLTSDKSMVINAISEIENGRLENGRIVDLRLKQGTAIGMGLASAVNRLRDSESTSKVVILMSDGENNTGVFTPDDAAELAKAYGVTVYTVGIGSNGTALFPQQNRWTGQITFSEQEVNIDEQLLYTIAEHTGGKYFRATSESQLAEVYQEIDKLEKTKFEETIIKTKSDVYWRFLLTGLVLIVLTFSLNQTVFRSVYS